MIEYEYIFGKHAVAEALAQRPDVVKQIFLDLNFSDAKIIKQVELAKVTVSPLNLKNPPRGVSANAAHQGIVAAINPDKLMVDYKNFSKNLEANPGTAVLILGEVQDPHNVGAVIRSAAAFGLAGVLIPPHNQAPVTGTVIKVSAGMAFRIPLVAISNVNAVIRDLQKRGFWVYGLEGDGTVSTTTEKFTKPTAFVLGNEGSGLREKTKEVCDDLISIPIHPRCESLNAAAATAVVLASWSAQHQGSLS
ncbi:23S rRNA (guanosine(2251)-2'-O)-methyltransferase RlmB [Candidatus Kaiserbacteria bacterium RIFCSPLOWO2_02_FULL_45_11b]|uniref:23S rRNA (Guanosine(2251)-2'-O)-methyltransferase RlmB n=1 Tax=Candidatus Kaiserbacteria bacterium RIFCSPLOWO2_12_FULL_45_26 TaxID=1798525 RepID=A0A1F6FG63_9BACT|nr:MAG: 23S rRNA (guanosine(2251)-2'-O)-methyltransferase RlmB [Candidatus Kaiserbacteria bacterium RIFCSPHIGHO2_12_45_16]OGG69912.1 MAG: 23S rRNA (guanosine(2251)-2'-O)-methyltransferase RlmB [Candidatus Kaiserbacteria bacterium RIFCSPLOWO2_01_FULL_45_25]OGG84300.1 MAG: 23S rRNA (guanosine(2251)-2'-O)-methyltransferase RlmB [Candidatus Kaiserbacteria bacterium RIFCSPLOWO2_02_FULL_45_11b]OGG84845.1 MAG: 23S rRNA (guanosine(2251)-2'-O)-methyltransferase RlmB [Candidatus Kaiserbacteria bacterium R